MKKEKKMGKNSLDSPSFNESRRISLTTMMLQHNIGLFVVGVPKKETVSGTKLMIRRKLVKVLYDRLVPLVSLKVTYGKTFIAFISKQMPIVLKMTSE